jgi:HD-GYP domain-containing protein (c-di-GMP phosphodiesterase class II)
LRAIATFVDLKSPYMLGHAAAVEELVALAGERAALSGAELQALKGAGLIHGLGRLGISNATRTCAVARAWRASGFVGYRERR